MNFAHALTQDYVIYYQIKQEPGQVKLKVWEPPPTPHSSSDHRYLYAVNFSFSRLGDAEAYLRQYLLVNGAFDVPEADFPAEGEIAILPFPTWGLDQ